MQFNVMEKSCTGVFFRAWPSKSFLPKKFSPQSLQDLNPFSILSKRIVSPSICKSMYELTSYLSLLLWTQELDERVLSEISSGTS